MDLLFSNASLMVVLGVVAIAVLAVLIYRYDAEVEAREKRMKWLLRNHARSVTTAAGLEQRLKSKLMGNRRDLLTAFAVGVLSVFAFAVLGVSLVWNLPLSLSVFILSAAVMLHLRKRHDRKVFETTFPEAVEMLTRSVKTGVPLDEAFLSLSERFEGDLARRFDIFQSELALGQPFRDAGVRFCRGLDMPDVEFFFAVLSLNRESGSELTPTLEAMSYTLRERQKLRRKAVVLTSEIRSSAKIMAALPFVVGIAMVFLHPKMVDFYLHDLTGQIILGCCLLSIAVGLLIIKEIANISD